MDLIQCLVPLEKVMGLGFLTRDYDQSGACFYSSLMRSQVFQPEPSLPMVIEQASYRILACLAPDGKNEPAYPALYNSEKKKTASRSCVTQRMHSKRNLIAMASNLLAMASNLLPWPILALKHALEGSVEPKISSKRFQET